MWRQISLVDETRDQSPQFPLLRDQLPVEVELELTEDVQGAAERQTKRQQENATCYRWSAVPLVDNDLHIIFCCLS